MCGVPRKHIYIHVCVCVRVWLLRTCIAACRCPRVYIQDKVCTDMPALPRNVARLLLMSCIQTIVGQHTAVHVH